MPNWCYNSVTFSHTDKNRIDALEQELLRGDNARTFNHLVPRPADKEENWYEWNTQHWGTKWDVTPYDWSRGGDTITMTFDSAWSPPTTLYETLTNWGWNISALYHEPGMCYIGKFEDGFDDYHNYDISSKEDIESLPEDLVDFGNLMEEHEDWKANNEDADETQS